MIYELFVYGIPSGFLVFVFGLLAWLAYLAIRGDSIKK